MEQLGKFIVWRQLDDFTSGRVFTVGALSEQEAKEKVAVYMNMKYRQDLEDSCCEKYTSSEFLAKYIDFDICQID